MKLSNILFNFRAFNKILKAENMPTIAGTLSNSEKVLAVLEKCKENPELFNYFEYETHERMALINYFTFGVQSKSEYKRLQTEIVDRNITELEQRIYSAYTDRNMTILDIATKFNITEDMVQLSLRHYGIVIDDENEIIVEESSRKFWSKSNLIQLASEIQNATNNELLNINTEIDIDSIDSELIQVNNDVWLGLMLNYNTDLEPIIDLSIHIDNEIISIGTIANNEIYLFGVNEVRINEFWEFIEAIAFKSLTIDELTNTIKSAAQKLDAKHTNENLKYKAIKWLENIIALVGPGFHPDNEFNEYEQQDGSLLFENPEELETEINEIFENQVAGGYDIYVLTMEIFRRNFNRKNDESSEENYSITISDKQLKRWYLLIEKWNDFFDEINESSIQKDYPFEYSFDELDFVSNLSLKNKSVEYVDLVINDFIDFRNEYFEFINFLLTVSVDDVIAARITTEQKLTDAVNKLNIEFSEDDESSEREYQGINNDLFHMFNGYIGFVSFFNHETSEQENFEIFNRNDFSKLLDSALTYEPMSEDADGNDLHFIGDLYFTKYKPGEQMEPIFAVSLWITKDLILHGFSTKESEVTSYSIDTDGIINLIADNGDVNDRIDISGANIGMYSDFENVENDAVAHTIQGFLSFFRL